MADSVNRRKKPAGVAASEAKSFAPRPCFHPVVDVGVGVVRAESEYRLVATRPISAGQLIFRIDGDLTQQPSRYSVQVGYQLHIDLHGELTMEEILDRYFWRFMNHSCAPSAAVRDRDVIAARDINPWELITFDYATTEWEMAEAFACACGGRDCRGRIQGYRFLDAEQRARLGPVAAHLGRYLTEVLR